MNPAADSGAPSVGAAPKPRMADLLLRSASGTVLVIFGLGIVWFGQLPLIMVTAMAAGLMAWELLRMAAPEAKIALRCIGGVLTGLVVWLGALSPLNTLISFVAFPFVMIGFMLIWRRYPWVSGFGILYIALACGAFLLIRGQMANGRELLLAMLVCIWSTDIAAYFGGRTFGGAKLAPIISPNKTWAGFLCGIAAGSVMGALAGWVIGGNVIGWLGLGLAFGAVGQGGDLLESWAKRHFGVKDTSGIIPGHGGILDRLDGHLTSATLFAALLLAWPSLALILA